MVNTYASRAEGNTGIHVHYPTLLHHGYRLKSSGLFTLLKYPLEYFIQTQGWNDYILSPFYGARKEGGIGSVGKVLKPCA